MSQASEPTDQLSSEIDELVTEVEEIFETLSSLSYESTNAGGKIKYDRVNWAAVDELAERYEIWYNRAITLVSEYLPARTQDFKNSYSDMDGFIHVDGMEYKKATRYSGISRRTIARQKNILLSIPPKLETERLKVQKTISDEIINEELYRAKSLWDDGDVRAAGVLAGIALERHLLTLCELNEQDLGFGYKDGIRSLAHTLLDAGVLTKKEVSQLGYLADVRNDCAHANEREPEKRDVERLIRQSEDIVRGF